MITKPLLSVVIETFNADQETEVEVDDVLKRLGEQTHPAECIEVLVVHDESNRGIAEYLKANYPDVRCLALRNANYFSMKNHGLKFARGEIIAFLDSDCLPRGNDWAERIVSTLSGGADVAAGKTRYAPGRLLAHTFDVFDFGHVSGDENGEASGILANNVAFGREVLSQHSFDDRLGRSGGCYLLGRQLKSLGYKIAYDPEQFAVHGYNIEGPKWIWKRIRLGFDAINLCRLDEDGVLPEQRAIKMGILAPFAIAASRVWFDFRRFVSNSADLGIPIYAIPWFCLTSVVTRSIEAIGGVITVVRPGYFHRKFGW